MSKCPNTECEVTFEFNDCLTNPNAKPKEGDCGMCYRCHTWWQLKDGEFVFYQPTPEEHDLVMGNLEASRRRFELIGGREN